MKKEKNVYTIRYTYKNGFIGSHKIVSRCESPLKLIEIIDNQLTRAKRAKFRVLTDSGVVNGWLLNMDIRSFSINHI